MTGISPLCSASFGKMSSATLFARSFCRRLTARSRNSGLLMPATSSSAPSAWYHSSSVFIWLSSVMDSR